MVYQRTIRPEDAPDQATVISVDSWRGSGGDRWGDVVAGFAADAAERAWEGERHRPAGPGREPVRRNEVAGVYETPGGTILLAAHRAIESITLDREAAHLKDSLMPRYAELIYNGFWFSPERRMLQALIDTSQASVTGGCG